MIKKEVLEIRRQFTPMNCAITRICGCYVNHEKEKVLEMKEAFLSLPEEETFKYFDIFKKALSGSIGKNLIDLKFPLDQEERGGAQEFLLRLRNSKLKDNALLDEFYNRVIESYNFVENYYIILIHAAYDIPGKSSDGFTMEDASDEVYEHLLCCICPVGLSKAGLSYDSDKNLITERLRDWVVAEPLNGFLFPAFTDRSTDIHSALFYTKKPKEIHPEFIEGMFGTEIPLSADSQKAALQTIIAGVLGDDCEYDVVKGIHERLYEKVVEHKEDPEPYEVTDADLRIIFENSGVSSESMEKFESAYKLVVPEKTSLLATNLIDTKKFSIEAPDVVIKVHPERMDLVETRVIDGRQCIVIATDSKVELNGLDVKVTR